MKRVAAFGVGSTNFRYAVGTTGGRILTEISVEPTRPTQLRRQISDAVSALESTTEQPLDVVSVSVAGLVRREEGTIAEIDTADGDAAYDLRLAETIRETFDLPLVLENDCNASALAEYAYGTDDATDCVVHVTMGTGIGAGAVERGRLLRGTAGQAGEAGLISVDPDAAEIESFGVPGAWEAYCSGRGIPGYVTHRLEDEPRDTPLRAYQPLQAEHLFTEAANGDPVANDCLDAIARYNASGLGALSNLYNPDVVTLGGGVALNNRKAILTGIERYVDRFCFVERPEVRITDFGDYIGLYGALAQTQHRAAPRSRPDF